MSAGGRAWRLGYARCATNVPHRRPTRRRNGPNSRAPNPSVTFPSVPRFAHYRLGGAVAGELGFDTGPYVNIATFCEKALQEVDGSLSLIRVMDQINVQAAG